MAKRDKTSRVLGSFRGRNLAPANELILPNLSGDHVRSIKRDAPIDAKDLVNKEYVDDEINTLTDYVDAADLLKLNIDKSNDGLIGWWRLDDDAANTTVIDYSGEESNGTFADPGGDANTNAHSISGKLAN